MSAGRLLRSLGAFCAAAWIGCVHAEVPAAQGVAESTIEYRIEVSAHADMLRVEARFPAGIAAELWIAAAAVEFVGGAEVLDDGAWRPIKREENHYKVSACAERPCTIRHTFDLASAAHRIDDLDLAADRGALRIGATSAWTLHPRPTDRGTPARLLVRTPIGLFFTSGMLSRHDARAPTETLLSVDATELDDPPLSVFSTERPRIIEVKGGHVDLFVTPARKENGTASDLRPDDALVTAWATRNVQAVAEFYGRLPLGNTLLIAVPHEGVEDDRVGEGSTSGGGGASIVVDIGARVTEKYLREDWVLPHELIHLAMPYLPPRQHWLEEGAAVYLEPIARVRLGQMTAQEGWLGLIKGLKKGLPGPNDEGLDNTPSWGRVYWGSALFLLLADIEIRERTGLAKGLADGFRAVVAEGGSIAVPWSIERIIEVADRATGVPVLEELYRKWKDRPQPVDVDRLLRELGISREGDSVRLDDRARLAAVRRKIMG